MRAILSEAAAREKRHNRRGGSQTRTKCIQIEGKSRGSFLEASRAAPLILTTATADTFLISGILRALTFTACAVFDATPHNVGKGGWMLLFNRRFRCALAILAAWLGTCAVSYAQNVNYISDQVAPSPVLAEPTEDTAETSAVMFQPAPAESTTQPDRRAATDSASRRTSTSTARRPAPRLASVPNMFGDFGAGGPVLTVNYRDQNAVGVPVTRTVSSTIIPPGGGRRAKIGEQNKALPDDRVYFFYNHFENAQSARDVTGALRQFPVDRYTMGFEKTLFDGVASIELRMPFSNSYNFVADPANPAEFNASGGRPGNLTVIPKLMLLQSPETIVAGGIGIEMPTGGDVDGQIIGGTYKFANEALHLSPYLAFMHQSTERLFWLGFAQLDLATNGNRVIVADPFLGGGVVGKYTEQNFAFIDLAGGYSFYLNPEARFLNLLALQGEVHYGGAINRADQLNNVRVGGPAFVAMNLTPLASDIQMVNVTFALTGIVAQNTFLRVGGSAPIRDLPNRFFDSEFQAAVIQRY